MVRIFWLASAAVAGLIQSPDGMPSLARAQRPAASADALASVGSASADDPVAARVEAGMRFGNVPRASVRPAAFRQQQASQGQGQVQILGGQKLQQRQGQQQGQGQGFFESQESGPANAYRLLINPVAPSLMAQGQQSPDSISFYSLGSRDDSLGATLAELEAPLRAQLQIEEGKGVIVTSVVPGGPAARVGLQTNDILIAIGELAISKPADLNKHLKTVGEQETALHVVRDGKALDIPVKPRVRVILAPPATQGKPSYYLGVQASPVEGALRSHLSLPEGSGLLVTEIVEKSPAADVLKIGDILMKSDGASLGDLESLQKQVGASEGKAITLVLLRGGKEKTVTVTPGVRPAPEEDDELVFQIYQPRVNWGNAPEQGRAWIGRNRLQNPAAVERLKIDPNGLMQDPSAIFHLRDGSLANPAQGGFDPGGDVSELRKEVEELHKVIEQLRGELKKN